MCDWEGCTTGTIGLPNPNRRSVVRTSGYLHPYIYRYTARVPRDRFLVLEGEEITWMGQPSCQGIALFSVRIEFWRSTAAPIGASWPYIDAMPSVYDLSETNFIIVGISSLLRFILSSTVTAPKLLARALVSSSFENEIANNSESRFRCD